ncbi:UBX domain protein [Onchocerca flexuosa]|uniref:UBX domain protein n=1 Tax=Onchocerca flexuosa TaxID=387005 RepID=A0A238BL09_9BILA|nr:UBX domain protein [Onchocerca flexuosa]
MADNEGSLAAQFRSVTGCTNAAEASQYLEMCNGNLELAVNLYFQQLQPSSSTATNSDESPDVIYVSKTTGRRNAVMSHRSMCGAPNPRTNHSNNDVSMADNNDVREPLAPIRGAIIEQTFAQQYSRQNGRHNTSVFDTARDFRAEAGERMAMLQNRHNTSDPTVAKRVTLQNLFRPPVDIMFSGDWDAVRAEAQLRGHWLLVNVQDDLEFACQALNRDVWSNSSVKELLQSNFVFWQVHKDSADGNRVSNYYRTYTYPAIFIVDPRTGEQLVTIGAKDTMSFCDQVTTFLDACPDFDARDKQIIAPTSSSFERSISREDCGSNQYVDVQNSRTANRKRVHFSQQDEVMDDDCSNPKKPCENNDWSDIDGIIHSGSKLTTIDRDEWLKCVGDPDGRGCRLLLSLRLPDGNRQMIEVEDTTTLKAIFVLIAGLGFYPTDHQLVLDYPKRVYTDQDHYRTLRELNFNKRELIHVERQ